MDDVLTKTQTKALELAFKGKNLFITGGAGTGKSFLLLHIAKELEAAGKTVLIAAPTGKAALKVGGVTIHRLLGLNTGVAVTKVGHRPMEHTALIKDADVLIIDEISMCRADVFDAVAASIKKAEAATGRSIQLIVCGDFCQLPPVSDKEDRKLLSEIYPDYGSGFAFSGLYWQQCRFENIVLDEVVRQKDKEFAENLNLLRLGDVSKINWFNERCPTGWDSSAISLFCTNKEVSARNQMALNSLDGLSVRIETKFSGDRKYFENGDVKKEIFLKEGAQIIMTANDSYAQETYLAGELFSSSKYQNGRLKRCSRLLYTNGEMGVFENYYNEDYLLIKVRGEQIVISRKNYEIFDYVKDKTCDGLVRQKVAEYKQFPIKLGYAITIHKSQGSTLERVNVFLGNGNTQISGRTYVALSRAVSVEYLHLDRKLMPYDVYLDEEVRAFYEALGKPAVGRPKKYTLGTKRVWVPEPLVKHVKDECELKRPIPLKRMPRYAPGRKQVRIPVEVAKYVEEQIRSWKTEVKR